MLLSAPVNWAAALAVRWQTAVACAARTGATTGNTAALERALYHPTPGRAGQMGRTARRLPQQGAFLTQLHIDACTDGHVEIVKLLLALPRDRGVDVTAVHNDAVCLACEGGHVEVVKLLLALPLEHGVNPAACGNYGLRWACANGHLEIVRLLLALPRDRGVDGPHVAGQRCPLRGVRERAHGGGAPATGAAARPPGRSVGE